VAQALPLGVEAVQQALDQAGLAPAEVDDLIVASCTGVDTPSLDVKIAEALGMSPYLRRSSMVGMGCQALMPSLYQAANAVLAQPQRRVVVLTLELCTLHFQQGRSLKNMLGSALFADGASAAVIGNGRQPGPRLLDSVTYSDYQTQENMTFHPGDTGYQIALSNDIPELIGEQTPPLVDCLLARQQLQRDEVSHWVVHPGGMKILDSVEETLALSPQALQHSRTILSQYGNMSSATLLFVLKRVIEKSRPAAGEYGIMLGFGPGLTIEVGLVEW
jgi:alkylresorcinol/alkylpyrone synthase